MKLLSYHIENYGKLHGVDGEFSSELTCFCEQNGFGKSTLASFIRAMFYGLPSYTVASKGFNDRQKYYPFLGGKFGGSLTFSYQGKIYRVERFFDKKSAKNDECTIYRDGVIFEEFGEELGRNVFGLDEDSFKRTVFINSEEIEISSTHTINEKLNYVVGGEEFGDDFEEAIAILERAKKELKATRGSNDKISEKRREIGELTSQIQNLQDMGERLSVEYTERERLEKEIVSLEKILANASDKNLILQKWATYDTILSQKRQREETLRALKEKYPYGYPNAEERQSLQNAWVENNRLRGLLQSSFGFSAGEERLRQLEDIFKNGIPRDEVIEEYQEKITRITALKREKKLLVESALREKKQRLEQAFPNGAPDEGVFEKMRRVVEAYKAKKREWEALTKERVEEKQKEKSVEKSKLDVYFFVLATALLCAGVGLFFVQQTLGFALGGAGLIFMAIAGALKLFKPTMPPLERSNGQETLALQTECEGLKEQIRSFTKLYGYCGDAGVLYDFATLEEDARAYREIVRLMKEEKLRLENLEMQIVLLERETQDFLRAYGAFGEDIQNGINKLLANIHALRVLQEDRKNAKAREVSVKETLQAGELRVVKLLEKYGLSENVATMDGLNGLEMDVKTFNECLRMLQTLENDAQRYKEDNDLTERPTEGVENVEDVRWALSKARKNLADCDKRIAETERDLEKLPEAENALQFAEEKLEEYKEKYELITDTLAALKEAEQALKDKYISPIKNRFSVYAEVLERVIGERISMDKDFKIVFERGGEMRSDRHLSAGERSLCALCLRFALIDNMYGEEQPFILMDDPFVHLDETHMVRTRALLHDLAKQKQIIYFCCHESRKI